MRGSNGPSLQGPFHGDNKYVIGGYHNNNSDSDNHYDYNTGANHPDSPSDVSHMTQATRRDEEMEEEDPNAPIVIRVIAPETLEDGSTMDVLYNGRPFTVELPRGGVQEGEEFETEIDPTQKYQGQYSSRSMMQMDQLAEEDEEEYSRRSSAYSKGEPTEQEEQRRQSQRSGSIGQQMESKLLSSAKIYDNGSEYTNETPDKTKEIEETRTFPAHSLSEDNEEEETMMEKTHIQNPKVNDEDNKDDDAEEEKEEKYPVSYDKNGTPHGMWRTRLFSCCDVLTQSTFWMGLFCTPVLMAQLITRLGLTWNGREGPPEETYLSYNRIVLGLVLVMSVYWIPVMGTVCVSMYYLLVIVYIGSQVRGYMRQKYNIPSTLPGWCGDRADNVCMMLCCGCCSSIQMVRHTHDDKDYPGHACTTTGLEFDATSIV